MPKLRRGTVPLSISNPNLCKEWDYSKNAPLTPDEVSKGYDKKVWWTCSANHSWEATVNSRTSMSSNCPYCSGRYAVKGVDDLGTLFPNIAKEWHPNKNGELRASDVKAHSNRKVWWMCSKKHEWQSTVNNRVQGKCCPYCSGSKTLDGYNDFKTWCGINQREDLLIEWNYEKNDITPSNISPKNSKRVWWKCSLGHEWEATIGSRTSRRPSGCPYCSNPPKKVLYGFNDFETWCIKNNKEFLLQEWNYSKNKGLTPRDITYSSGKRIWWKCNRGHEWCVPTHGRVTGNNCPRCSKTQTSFPEQAIAFYISKSFNVIQRYRDKNYEIDIYIKDYGIGIEYDGMFYHNAESVNREKEKDQYYESQDISIIHIKEDKHKNSVDGGVIYYTPPRKQYLNANFNTMMVNLLTLLEEKTKVHVDKDVDIVRDELKVREQYASIISNSSFAAVYPELVPEWDVDKNNGLKPEYFSANINTKVWWKCSQGHSWKAAISSRGSRKLGCPYCAGQKTIDGVNDLESWSLLNNTALLDEWDYERNIIKPSEISKLSNKKVWWKCSKGHEWEAVIANRVKGTRCPLCFTGSETKRNSVSLSEWCKLNNQEHLLEEWDYVKNANITPQKVSKGSHIKVWWKCKLGHEWQAQIKSRTYNHGCPYCSGTNKRASIGNNDLVTWCQDNNKQYILEEWDYERNDGLLPEDFTFGSHKRINWKCKYGHTWNAVIKERTKYHGNMCPECKK